jgi:glycosyltransferase involved in cell wall biosynthesis
MDLVADMLFERLERNHAAEFSTSRICPSFHPHFLRVPLLRRRPFFFNADRLTHRFVDYPRWLRREARDFDLFHIVDHSYAQLVHHLPPERTIVTCHDLDTFRCLLHPEREPRPRWFRAIAARTLSGLQKAAHVIAVSAATRDDIIGHGLFPADRVTVISNGVHPSCSPLPNEGADADLARLLPSDFGSAVWLLNVGSTMARKRLDVLLRVLAAVRRQRPEVRLLRAGGRLTPEQRQLARQLDVDNALVEMPFLSRETLAAVYRRAHLLVHTAEAEGFGLPIVEAMACGCPVVASDLQVLREVGGAAAVYCPVADVQACSDAVIRLLEEREHSGAAWDHRRQQAIAQGSHFGWGEAARQTAGVYTAVLERTQAENHDTLPRKKHLTNR